MKQSLCKQRQTTFLLEKKVEIETIEHSTVQDLLLVSSPPCPPGRAASRNVIDCRKFSPEFFSRKHFSMHKTKDTDLSKEETKRGLLSVRLFDIDVWNLGPGGSVLGTASLLGGLVTVVQLLLLLLLPGPGKYHLRYIHLVFPDCVDANSHEWGTSLHSFILYICNDMKNIGEITQ